MNSTQKRLKISPFMPLGIRWFTESREIYILVIGEASRAKNWSLWGYERETNPRTEKRRKT